MFVWLSSYICNEENVEESRNRNMTTHWWYIYSVLSPMVKKLTFLVFYIYSRVSHNTVLLD